MIADQIKDSFLLVLFCALFASCALTSCAAKETPRPDFDAEELNSLTLGYAYGGPLPEFSTPVTLEELRMAYYQYSPSLIIRAMREGGRENWRYIMDKISSGDKDWIGAFWAYAGSGLYGDGGAMLDVKKALVSALIRNPEAVLELEIRNPGYSLEDICNNITLLTDRKSVLAPAYAQKAVQAVRGVDKTYLQDSRDTCIRRMEGNLERWKQMEKEKCAH